MSASAGAGSDDDKEVGTDMPPHVQLNFPVLLEAVTAALVEVADDDPLEVARGCGRLLEALHQQILIVQSRRDLALVQVLRSSRGTSHYALARELGVSRQRIDQLAARVAAAAGGQDAGERTGG